MAPLGLRPITPANVLGVIMGGGEGRRLFPLTKERAKPAVPIAGKYRLVDIPISNCAQKFKTRYATFGFSDKANLDEGAMWPTAFALTALAGADEARIGALVKKAVS